MRTIHSLLGCAILAAATVPGLSIATSPSDYAGQETREIKSLSAADIEDLQHGRGWGLAKAAELNGVPGPLHALELKEALELTDEQTRKIEALFETMRVDATRLGRRLIEQERTLDRSFLERSATESTLRSMLERIAGTRSELRYVHLVAHLKTLPLLTPEQATAYVRLRGYTGGDPCSSVPAGHDAAMWKRHHGCEEGR